MISPTNNANTRILVTGGVGLIGSNLIFELNRRGYTNITIVDRLGSGSKWRNLVGLKYAEYLEVDAFRTQRANQGSDYDIAFLLGACSSTRQLDASYLASNNVYDLIDTIDWLRKSRWVPLASGGYTSGGAARIIYASSAATYGAGPQSDDLVASECAPSNAYALSKTMIDQTLESSGLLGSIVGLKYFNVFGPNSQHKGVMTDFVSKTYDSIKKDGYVTMYDTHTHSQTDARDFLYVKDAVDMTLFFALDEKGQKANGLFNIGSGAAHSWREVASQTLGAYMAFSGEILPYRNEYIEYKAMPDDLRAKYQYHTLADISKLRAAGYDRAITQLPYAIADYVKHYLVLDKRRGEVKV